MTNSTLPKTPVPGRDRGGVWVPLGDQQYKVAPLNFKALRALEDDLKALGAIQQGTMPSSDQVAKLAKIGHAALQRNYPDMPVEDVEDLLDLGNFGHLFSAVVGASELIEEPAEPGEAGTPPS